MSMGFNSDDFEEGSRLPWYRKLFRRRSRIVLKASPNDVLVLRSAAKRLGISVSELILDILMKNLPKETAICCRYLTASKPSDLLRSYEDVKFRGFCTHQRRQSLPCHWPVGLERQCPYFSE